MSHKTDDPYSVPLGNTLTHSFQNEFVSSTLSSC